MNIELNSIQESLDQMDAEIRAEILETSNLEEAKRSPSRRSPIAVAIREENKKEEEEAKRPGSASARAVISDRRFSSTSDELEQMIPNRRRTQAAHSPSGMLMAPNVRRSPVRSPDRSPGRFTRETHERNHEVIEFANPRFRSSHRPANFGRDRGGPNPFRRRNEERKRDRIGGYTHNLIGRGPSIEDMSLNQYMVRDDNFRQYSSST